MTDRARRWCLPAQARFSLGTEGTGSLILDSQPPVPRGDGCLSMWSMVCVTSAQTDQVGSGQSVWREVGAGFAPLSGAAFLQACGPGLPCGVQGVPVGAGGGGRGRPQRLRGSSNSRERRCGPEPAAPGGRAGGRVASAAVSCLGCSASSYRGTQEPHG